MEEPIGAARRGGHWVDSAVPARVQGFAEQWAVLFQLSELSVWQKLRPWAIR